MGCGDAAQPAGSVGGEAAAGVPVRPSRLGADPSPVTGPPSRGRTGRGTEGNVRPGSRQKGVAHGRDA